MRWFFGVLVLLLFFGGCLTQEQWQELRFECVSLSSGAFAMVPECDSQEECYEKVKKELFDFFDDATLEFESRRILEEYKNYLALSWRYFNTAQKELEEIRKLCWSESKFQELPLHVNRLNDALIQAFNASDEANKRAFVFLVVQKNWLTTQKLDLVREEPLFDDWILLQNNLNQLQSKNTNPSNSFAGKILQTQAKINQIFSQYGLEQQFVTSQHLADIVPEHRQDVLKNLPKAEPLLPIFGGLVIDLTGQFTEAQRIQESIATLKTFPAFPFFSGYRDLVGTNDSVAQETAILTQTLVEHQDQLNKKIDELQQTIEEKLKTNQQKIHEFSLEEDMVEPRTLEILVLALQPQTRISLQQFEVSDFSHAQSRLAQQLVEIQNDFSRIMEQKALGTKVLGETLQDLKQSQAKLEEWQSNFFFLENEFKSGLIELCSERIQQIQNQVLEEHAHETALELQAQTRYFITEFKEKQENQVKLFNCSKAIQSFENLSLFLQDQSQFEAERDEQTKQCMVFLENVFDSMPETMIGLEWLWKNLQAKSQEPTSDLQELELDCQSLEQKVTNRILNTEAIIEIQNNFLAIQQYWTGLQQLSVVQERPASFQVLDKQIQELQKFFENNQPRLEKIVPLLSEIQAQTQNQKKEIRELFGIQLRVFLEEKAKIQSFSETILETNQTNWVTSTFVFSNPTSIEWKQPLSILTTGEWKEPQLLEASQNITKIEEKPNGLTTWFSSVPSGISTAKIQSKQSVSTQEKNEFLFINQFKALLQKKIEFETKSEFQELKVHTTLETENATGVWVIFRNKEIAFSRNGKSLSFRLEKVSQKNSAMVFFTIPNPLKLIENISMIENQLEWKIEIHNTLSETIPTPQIFLALPTQAASALEARDEKGKKLSITTLESEIRIELKELTPRQTTIITVFGIVDDQQTLLEEIIKETKQALEELIRTAQGSQQQSARRLLAELLGVSQSENATLGTVFKLANETRELQEKAKTNRFDEQQFLETKTKIGEKISELEKLATQLFEQDFLSIGEELEQRIQKAKQLLAQADLSSENQDFQAASILALKALAALEEGKTTNRKAFEAKQQELQKNGKEIIELISELLSDNTIALQEKQTITEALIVLEQSAWHSNSQEFLQQLETTKTILEEAKQKVNQLVQEKAENANQTIQSFQILVSEEGLQAQLKIMLSWFSENSEKEVIQTGIFLPFQKKDLEKRFQQSIGLLSEKQVRFLNEFQLLFEKNEFAQAISLFTKTKKELEENLEKAKTLKTETEND
ncbi:hypothetical protein KKE06_05975, partial [Candidatus Micrarchaeota archaeon]|nr:hypothetical protein [Candidatus Micrarchaeota archaeon]